MNGIAEYFALRRLLFFILCRTHTAFTHKIGQQKWIIALEVSVNPLVASSNLASGDLLVDVTLRVGSKRTHALSPTAFFRPISGSKRRNCIARRKIESR